MPEQPEISNWQTLYADDRLQEMVVPWDIGRPQPVVEQLVAFGGVRGEVLDPGTGPGYHAIHMASQGYSVTGIDCSPTVIGQARRNAERAGVDVALEVADATVLDGFTDRFDTVVDSAFYHVFLDDEQTQMRYVTALHNATKPGARLYMFEFGRHNVNGLQWEGLSADNFQRVLPDGGWRIDYLGTSTYQAYFAPQMLPMLLSSASSEVAHRMGELKDRFEVILPMVQDYLVHVPIWVLACTRID